MLVAYYEMGDDSGEMFQGLSIEKTPDFKKHLNQYNVIFLNMQDFLSLAGKEERMTACLEKYLLKDLRKEYGKEIDVAEKTNSGFGRLISSYKKRICIYYR